MNEVKTGTVEGTGAAINVQLGFQPDYVKVYNYDSAGVEELEWFSGMTNGHAIKKTGAPARTKITSNGISAYGGTAGGNGAGFTVGADTDVNVASETLFWLAVRNGCGSQS
ncbi:MAG: hypothetical protein GY835_09345 [bacterium]|nr:hypothetical protein [bacterium]